MQRRGLCSQRDASGGLFAHLVPSPMRGVASSMCSGTTPLPVPKALGLQSAKEQSCMCSSVDVASFRIVMALVRAGGQGLGPLVVAVVVPGMLGTQNLQRWSIGCGGALRSGADKGLPNAPKGRGARGGVCE